MICVICGRTDAAEQRLNGIWFCDYHLNWFDAEVADWNDYYQVIEKAKGESRIVFEGLKFAADAFYRGVWSDVFLNEQVEDYNTANLSEEAFNGMISDYIDLFASGDDELKVYYLEKVQNGSGW